jgi:high-affinity iron transporter
MLPSFVLSLREVLEAALIIGILMGALVKFHQERYRSAVWAGVAGAAFLSLAAALILHALGADLEGKAEVIFEGSTLLFASALLTWMIFWMGRQARGLKSELEIGVRSALHRGGRQALFTLAFISVLREGIELALYLTAVGLGADSRQVLAGFLLGLGAAVLFGVSLFASLVRLDLRRFFSLTGFILVLFAAGMVAHGVREFTEIGWVPVLIPHIWDTQSLMSDTSFLGQLFGALFGYSSSPSLVELVAYLGYFAAVGVSLLLGRRAPTRAETA